jgi:hypothetical protein
LLAIAALLVALLCFSFLLIPNSKRLSLFCEPTRGSANVYACFASIKKLRPTPLRRQINADVNGTMRLPRINKEMMDRGSDPGPLGSDEDFTRFLHADMAKWERLIRERQLLIG